MATLSKAKVLKSFAIGKRTVVAEGDHSCGFNQTSTSDGQIEINRRIDVRDAKSRISWRLELNEDEALRIAARLALSLGKRIVDSE